MKTRTVGTCLLCCLSIRRLSCPCFLNLTSDELISQFLSHLVTVFTWCGDACHVSTTGLQLYLSEVQNRHFSGRTNASLNKKTIFEYKNWRCQNGRSVTFHPLICLTQWFSTPAPHRVPPHYLRSTRFNQTYCSHYTVNGKVSLL